MKKWIVVFALSFAAGAQNSLEVRYKAALHSQNVDGDLKKAIEQYQRVIAQAGSNRDLAARALLQIGECHEKLGDIEARQSYERILKEFGDRGEVVARARARLAALGQPAASGVSVRLV